MTARGPAVWVVHVLAPAGCGERRAPAATTRAGRCAGCGVCGRVEAFLTRRLLGSPG